MTQADLRARLAASDPAYARLLERLATSTPAEPVIAHHLGTVIPAEPWPGSEEARERLERDRLWYVGLPAAVKEGADRCEWKETTTHKTCCGEVQAWKCVGGRRDGQFLDVLACARCTAEHMGVPT